MVPSASSRESIADPRPAEAFPAAVRHLLVHDEYRATSLNRGATWRCDKRAGEVTPLDGPATIDKSQVVGSMDVAQYLESVASGLAVVAREDLVLAAASIQKPLAGIVLTGNLRPSESVLKIIRELSYPVLLVKQDNYEAASTVHNLIVKTRPDDAEKIALIRDLIGQHVDVKRILQSIQP